MPVKRPSVPVVESKPVRTIKPLNAKKNSSFSADSIFSVYSVTIRNSRSYHNYTIYNLSSWKKRELGPQQLFRKTLKVPARKLRYFSKKKMPVNAPGVRQIESKPFAHTKYFRADFLANLLKFSVKVFFVIYMTIEKKEKKNRYFQLNKFDRFTTSTAN